MSGIVFLHASARAASNDMSYRYIPNFPDTVPVRFGVNTLPLGGGKQPDTVAKGNAKELSYAYEADLVECGEHTLFAYGLSVVKKRPVPPAESVKL